MNRCGGVVAALLAAVVVAPVAGDAAESEAPYCEDIDMSQEQMETATQEAMATGQFNNAWTDPAQWDGVIKAVESRLGCRMTKPVSPESAALQTRAHAASSEAEARTVYESAQGDAQALAALASNIYCPSDLLVALSVHEAPDVRFAVASNPKTPPETLQGFLGQRGVYGGVAANPNTPSDVLAELAADPFFFVKLGVIENGATSREILAGLAKDADANVALAAQRRLQPDAGAP